MEIIKVVLTFALFTGLLFVFAIAVGTFYGTVLKGLFGIAKDATVNLDDAE